MAKDQHIYNIHLYEILNNDIFIINILLLLIIEDNKINTPLCLGL